MVGLVSQALDYCITQLKAQGLSRSCNESRYEEGELIGGSKRDVDDTGYRVFAVIVDPFSSCRFAIVLTFKIL